MSLQVRLLNPEEFPLMDGIPDPDKVELRSENCIVAGAFDGERLVGRLVAINLPHVECAWIAPEHRGGGLLARMEKAIEKELRRLGARIGLAIAVNGEMEDYCRRFGCRKLGTIWIKEI